MLNQNKPDKLQCRKRPNFCSQGIYIFMYKVKITQSISTRNVARRNRWTCSSRKVGMSLNPRCFLLLTFCFTFTFSDEKMCKSRMECTPTLEKHSNRSSPTGVTAASKGQLFFWSRLEVVQLQMPSFCLLCLLYFTIACLLELRDN